MPGHGRRRPAGFYDLLALITITATTLALIVLGVQINDLGTVALVISSLYAQWHGRLLGANRKIDRTQQPAN